MKTQLFQQQQQNYGNWSTHSKITAEQKLKEKL